VIDPIYTVVKRAIIRDEDLGPRVRCAPADVRFGALHQSAARLIGTRIRRRAPDNRVVKALVCSDHSGTRGYEIHQGIESLLPSLPGSRQPLGEKYSNQDS